MTLESRASDCHEDVKAKTQDDKDIPTGKHRLTFAGQQLEDGSGHGRREADPPGVNEIVET
jgi:ubiquitin